MDKRLFAPTIITLLLVGYFSLWLLGFWLFPHSPVVLKLLAAIISCTLIGISIFVFRERIKEIKKGEENDLSQY